MFDGTEYTPALLLVVAEGVTDKVDSLSGSSDVVIVVVVGYLIIKLFLDHTSKLNKGEKMDKLIQTQEKLTTAMKDLIEIFNRNR